MDPRFRGNHLLVVVPSSGKHVFLIFGAAVRPDGSPSGTLMRRVLGAIAAAEHVEDVAFVPTGAVGRHGPAEADVMRSILREQGVPTQAIFCERAGSDTLSSAIRCAEIIETAFPEPASVTVCSSAYHRPRCIWLMRRLGLPAQGAATPSDRPHLSRRKLTYYWLRELPALIWDTLALPVVRRRLKSP